MIRVFKNTFKNDRTLLFSDKDSDVINYVHTFLVENGLKLTEPFHETNKQRRENKIQSVWLITVREGLRIRLRRFFYLKRAYIVFKLWKVTGREGDENLTLNTSMYYYQNVNDIREQSFLAKFYRMKRSPKHETNYLNEWRKDIDTFNVDELVKLYHPHIDGLGAPCKGAYSSEFKKSCAMNNGAPWHYWYNIIGFLQSYNGRSPFFQLRAHDYYKSFLKLQLDDDQLRSSMDLRRYTNMLIKMFKRIFVSNDELKDSYKSFKKWQGMSEKKRELHLKTHGEKWYDKHEKKIIAWFLTQGTSLRDMYVLLHWIDPFWTRIDRAGINKRVEKIKEEYGAIIRSNDPAHKLRLQNAKISFDSDRQYGRSIYREAVGYALFQNDLSRIGDIPTFLRKIHDINPFHPIFSISRGDVNQLSKLMHAFWNRKIGLETDSSTQSRKTQDLLASFQRSVGTENLAYFIIMIDNITNRGISNILDQIYEYVIRSAGSNEVDSIIRDMKASFDDIQTRMTWIFKDNVSDLLGASVSMTMVHDEITVSMHNDDKKLKTNYTYIYDHDLRYINRLLMKFASSVSEYIPQGSFDLEGFYKFMIQLNSNKIDIKKILNEMEELNEGKSPQDKWEYLFGHEMFYSTHLHDTSVELADASKRWDTVNPLLSKNGRISIGRFEDYWDEIYAILAKKVVKAIRSEDGKFVTDVPEASITRNEEDNNVFENTA